MSVETFDTNLGPLTDAEMILKLQLHVVAREAPDAPRRQNLTSQYRNLMPAIEN